MKTKLMKRYDTDEMNRRTGLTYNQHRSPTGKIGSEGFREHTTIKGVPYLRDRSPQNNYHGKHRQYAFQNEFIQSNKHRYAAHGDDVSPYRWKRDDGNDRLNNSKTNLTAFNFRKRQPVVKQLSGD